MNVVFVEVTGSDVTVLNEDYVCHWLSRESAAVSVTIYSGGQI